jgi:glutamyl-Q tRNA(Asp) synthetase
MPVIGRFAPSPTGDLHFGSLVAAVASFLNAKSQGGNWLVRIENIDPPREVAGSATRILADLQRFGLRSDEPVLYQASRTAAYKTARDRLLSEGKAYWCGCSRADLPASGIYPGTCRNGLPAGRKPRSVRLHTGPETIRFEDRIMGTVEENLAETSGDFVIWRADDLPAYQLAVALDDAFQGISEVVRGYDLIGSTARQIRVQQCLELATPVYAHHPVVAGDDGSKLSKSLDADPVKTEPRALTLNRALRFLGQASPGLKSLTRTWQWALQNWRLDRVPKQARIVPENGLAAPGD